MYTVNGLILMMTVFAGHEFCFTRWIAYLVEGLIYILIGQNDQQQAMNDCRDDFVIKLWRRSLDEVKFKREQVRKCLRTMQNKYVQNKLCKNK